MTFFTRTIIQSWNYRYTCTVTGSPSIQNVIYRWFSIYISKFIDFRTRLYTLLWVMQWSKKALFLLIFGKFGRNRGSTYTSISPKVCVAQGKTVTNV